MESFTDKARAFFYSLTVHLSVFALLFLGLFFFQPARPVALHGPVIEATIVGPAAAPRPQPVSKPKPEPPKPVAPPPTPEPPKPEPPKPPEVKPPPTVQRNDNREQEKIAESGMQKAEEAKRAQEEKHRQQQILLEEEKKREEAEAKEKQRKEEIAKQLEDIRKERAANEKKLKLAQEKMQQLDDLQKQQSQPKKVPPAPDVPVAETAKTGMAGNDTGLLAEYSSAIIKVVTDNWNRPDTVQAGLRCAVHVIQLPGGTVMSAKAVSPCNADQVTRTSIEQAVTKAQPLPYKGYESVFQREITFTFRYDG